MTDMPDARPGIVPPHPLGVGSILGGALRLVLRHPVVTVGTTVIANVVGAGALAGVVFALGGVGSLPARGLPVAIAITAGALLYVLVAAGFVGATHLVVLDRSALGHRVGLVESGRGRCGTRRG